MNNQTRIIFSTKKEVERLLNKYPEYRDDDERLVAKFWYLQLRNFNQNPDTMTAVDFLMLYAKGQLLTSADTIVRARAKAQEDKPELRGDKWLGRHTTGTTVAQEINKI